MLFCLSNSIRVSNLVPKHLDGHYIAVKKHIWSWHLTAKKKKINAHTIWDHSLLPYTSLVGPTDSFLATVITSTLSSAAAPHIALSLGGTTCGPDPCFIMHSPHWCCRIPVECWHCCGCFWSRSAACSLFLGSHTNVAFSLTSNTSWLQTLLNHS